jgi:multicomponent Na+:H+ antiporter subunit E
MTDLLRRTALRSYRIARFIGYFIYELAASNVMVGWEIATPRSGLSPVVIAMPLRVRPGSERTAFVGIVTLTPGTLSLDLSDRPSVLYVHGMHAHDIDRFRARLVRLENMLIAAWRPVRADHDADADADAQTNAGTDADRRKGDR